MVARALSFNWLFLTNDIAHLADQTPYWRSAKYARTKPNLDLSFEIFFSRVRSESPEVSAAVFTGYTTQVALTATFSEVPWPVVCLYINIPPGVQQPVPSTGGPYTCLIDQNFRPGSTYS